MRANSITILGHRHTTPFGMGEKTLCLKLEKMLKCPVIDLLEWMSDLYEPLAKLNFALADSGHSIIEDLSLAKPISHNLPPSDIFLLLSVSASVAAFLATGLHKTRTTIVKLYAHHRNERVLTKLYEPADLIITESLLASERALAYGFSEKKVLHLPHHYPHSCERIKPSREYVERLALSQKKKIDSKTLIIGLVSRLEYGKNCEFAVEAIRKMALDGENVVLVLKGDFPKESPYFQFREKFSEMLHTYKDENWLLWDKKETSFPRVLREYSSFDLLLHPSGAEGASHVAVEALGLGKPVILLDCSSNSYLFKGLATFVKTTDKIQNALLPFYIPNMDELISVLQSKSWILPDAKVVKKRFHPKRVQSRLNYLFDRDPDKIARLYDEDRRLYEL